MKTQLLFPASLALAATLFTGCGQKAETAAAAPAPTPAATAPAPAPEPEPAAPAVEAHLIEVTGNDTMRFNVTEITAQAGETITIKLTNAGTLPKAAMGHNLVVLKLGVNATTFANAAVAARDSEYIPAQLENQIIAHTKLLGPGESDSITFTVPAAAGDYPFICSFPAHAMAGMKGILKVSE